MKRIGILFLLFLPTIVFSQKRIYASAIVGTYQMSDMKKFQEELVKGSYTVPLKIVSSFPASLQCELGVDSRDSQYTKGAFISYAVTNGRFHYADYSGSVLGKLYFQRVMAGLKGMISLEHYNLHVYGKLGFCATFLDISYASGLTGGTMSSDDLKFTSFGGSVEPGLQWEYPVKRFTFCAHAGYELNFNGKLKYTEADKAYLVDQSGQSVRGDWSGVRCALSVAYHISN